MASPSSSLLMAKLQAARQSASTATSYTPTVARAEIPTPPTSQRSLMSTSARRRPSPTSPSPQRNASTEDRSEQSPLPPFTPSLRATRSGETKRDRAHSSPASRVSVYDDSPNPRSKKKGDTRPTPTRGSERRYRPVAELLDGEDLAETGEDEVATGSWQRLDLTRSDPVVPDFGQRSAVSQVTADTSLSQADSSTSSTSSLRRSGRKVTQAPGKGVAPPLAPSQSQVVKRVPQPVETVDAGHVSDETVNELISEDEYDVPASYHAHFSAQVPSKGKAKKQQAGITQSKGRARVTMSQPLPATAPRRATSSNPRRATSSQPVSTPGSKKAQAKSRPFFSTVKRPPPLTPADRLSPFIPRPVSPSDDPLLLRPPVGEDADEECEEEGVANDTFAAVRARERPVELRRFRDTATNTQEDDCQSHADSNKEDDDISRTCEMQGDETSEYGADFNDDYANVSTQGYPDAVTHEDYDAAAMGHYDDDAAHGMWNATADAPTDDSDDEVEEGSGGYIRPNDTQSLSTEAERGGPDEGYNGVQEGQDNHGVSLYETGATEDAPEKQALRDDEDTFSASDSDLEEQVDQEAVEGSLEEAEGGQVDDVDADADEAAEAEETLNNLANLSVTREDLSEAESEGEDEDEVVQHDAAQEHHAEEKPAPQPEVTQESEDGQEELFTPEQPQLETPIEAIESTMPAAMHSHSLTMRSAAGQSRSLLEPDSMRALLHALPRSTPIVEVMSSDAVAAARAAAILRVHHNWIHEGATTTHEGDEHGAEASLSAFRGQVLGSDPMLSTEDELPALLKAAETALRAQGAPHATPQATASRMQMITPDTSLLQAPTPRVPGAWSWSPASNNNVPDESASAPVTTSLHMLMERNSHVFPKAAWRSLEKSFRRYVRQQTSEQDVEERQVVAALERDNVVERFLKANNIDHERLRNRWCYSDLLKSVRALQRHWFVKFEEANPGALTQQEAILAGRSKRSVSVAGDSQSVFSVPEMSREVTASPLPSPFLAAFKRREVLHDDQQQQPHSTPVNRARRESPVVEPSPISTACSPSIRGSMSREPETPRPATSNSSERQSSVGESLRKRLCDLWFMPRAATPVQTEHVEAVLPDDQSQLSADEDDAETEIAEDEERAEELAAAEDLSKAETEDLSQATTIPEAGQVSQVSSEESAASEELHSQQTIYPPLPSAAALPETVAVAAPPPPPPAPTAADLSLASARAISATSAVPTRASESMIRASSSDTSADMSSSRSRSANSSLLAQEAAAAAANMLRRRQLTSLGALGRQWISPRKARMSGGGGGDQSASRSPVRHRSSVSIAQRSGSFMRSSPDSPPKVPLSPSSHHRRQGGDASSHFVRSSSRQGSSFVQPTVLAGLDENSHLSARLKAEELSELRRSKAWMSPMTKRKAEERRQRALEGDISTSRTTREESTMWEDSSSVEMSRNSMRRQLANEAVAAHRLR
ncbi:unnamed protein product [Jaminaea pallidilutea]